MIHLYRLGDYAIVLDVYSGAVHLLDDVTFDLLTALSPDGMPPVEILTQDSIPTEMLSLLQKTHPTAELVESFQEVKALVDAGLLWSRDDYAPFAEQLGIAPVKALCLHIAHDCNLRCEYCFASTGGFGATRGFLSAETGKKAIDFLLAHSGDRKNLEVDFFGGEPLMNFDVVRQVVSYARSKEAEHQKVFRFTITTNGVLLDDEIIDYINQEMYNVVLSLDGRPHVNDALRPAPDGSGSYDVIVPKFQKLVQKRLAQKPHGNWQYYLRGTFTANNLDFANDVLHLHELGFDEISVEPVVTEAERSYAIRTEHLPMIFAEYERLAEQLIAQRRDAGSAERELHFFHFLLDLSQGPCTIKRLRGCGSGNEYLAVTPQGDLYPCHQFVGMDDWKMGNLDDEPFVLDQEKRAIFAEINVYEKPACRDCWAKFYCSGGCHANHLQYGGDLTTPHEISCLLLKKRLECALMMEADAHSHG